MRFSPFDQTMVPKKHPRKRLACGVKNEHKTFFGNALAAFFQCLSPCPGLNKPGRTVSVYDLAVL
jgi:hypothetical protein